MTGNLPTHTPTSTQEAEQALAEWGVPFTKRPDGSLFVIGNLYVGARGLELLPDLSRVTVEGCFDCSDNKLVSLIGLPDATDYDLSDNLLASLHDAPEKVRGHFNVKRNRLETLAGAPRWVGETFDCSENPLPTLAGGPDRVVNYYCRQTQIKNLKGIADYVGKYVDCSHIPGIMLDYPPKRYQLIHSDMGQFLREDGIPAAFTTPFD